MLQRLQGWWESTSLRTKITGATVLVLALALSGIGVGTVMGLERYLMAELDRKIDAVALGLPQSLSMQDFADFDTTASSGARSNYFLGAVSTDGELLASNVATDESGYQPDVALFTAGGSQQQSLRHCPERRSRHRLAPSRLLFEHRE